MFVHSHIFGGAFIHFGYIFCHEAQFSHAHWKVHFKVSFTESLKNAKENLHDCKLCIKRYFGRACK